MLSAASRGGYEASSDLYSSGLGSIRERGCVISVISGVYPVFGVLCVYTDIHNMDGVVLQACVCMGRLGHLKACPLPRVW